jgi:uncharacterized protein YyaL (SSP411 family)
VSRTDGGDGQGSAAPAVRGEGVPWRAWGPDAFAEAAEAGRPIFLSLQTRWCTWCRRLEQETFADRRVAGLLAESVVPIRADAERFPHVRDRYVTSGWPTNAFLTPSGGVLWSGPFVEAAELLTAARRVLAAWERQAEELEAELERRRAAIASARRQGSRGGMPRREAADSVLTFLRQSFDERNGGFGEAPKYPPVDAVALLYAQAERVGDAELLGMADRTLDGMLAGELVDPETGAFHRYALAADWTEPSTERLLTVNAELARCYALSAAFRDRADWREVAERAVDWAADALERPDGLMAGSVAAGAGVAARDDTAFADANAAWVRCLADAGAALGRADWVERAGAALEAARAAFDDDDASLLRHFVAEDADGAPRGLLVDAAEMLTAAVAVARASGEAETLAYASDLAERMRAELWSEDGGFRDRPHVPDDPLGAPERPFHENATAAAALLFLDALAEAGGTRSQAERTLAFLSPTAPRYGLDAAGFALATLEFFDAAPVAVVRTNGAAGALRTAVANSARGRCWNLTEDAPVAGRTFEAAGDPAAWVKRDGDWSGPVTEASELRALLGG